MKIEAVKAESVGYLQLLRSNHNFRNLWLGQVISELGDWFATVALLNLMLDLTGRAQVVGWFFIIIHLPSGIIGPFAGVIVDRINRKKLMIAMDLSRAVVVLGYLLVWRADQIWLLYVVAALEVAMMTLFEPARTASVPNICSTRELIPANTLASLTWSVLLAIGGALGGFITAAFGRHVCYLIDSLSFVGSAILISRVKIPPSTLAHRTGGAQYSALGGFRDIAEGFRYMAENVRTLTVVLVKTGWSLGLGVILVISIFGQTIFPVMGSGAAGIGILYGARGIGTALGPVLARRVTGESRTSMRHAITVGFFVASLSYVLFGHAPNLICASFALMIAHAGGSIAWVFSTVLLQLEVPDEFRGRVFSIEFAFLILGIAVSNFVAGYWLDVVHLSARTVATLLGLYFVIPGALWMAVQHLHKSQP